jgi:hypothetical protein
VAVCRYLGSFEEFAAVSPIIGTENEYCQLDIPDEVAEDKKHR